MEHIEDSLMRIYLLSRMLAALVATPASILSLEKLAELLGGSCFVLYTANILAVNNTDFFILKHEITVTTTSSFIGAVR